MVKTKAMRAFKKRWKRGIKEAVREPLRNGRVVAVAPAVVLPDGTHAFMNLDIITKSSWNIKERTESMKFFGSYAGTHDIVMSAKSYKPEDLPDFLDRFFGTFESRRQYLGRTSEGVIVLACLVNQDRYPAGGKSVNLLAAEFARLFFNDSSHYNRRCSDGLSAMIRRGLRDLIAAGLVVKGMSGAFFFKPTFRELMTEQGISFLPLYQGKINV